MLILCKISFTHDPANQRPYEVAHCGGLPQLSHLQHALSLVMRYDFNAHLSIFNLLKFGVSLVSQSYRSQLEPWLSCLEFVRWTCWMSTIYQWHVGLTIMLGTRWLGIKIIVYLTWIHTTWGYVKWACRPIIRYTFTQQYNGRNRTNLNCAILDLNILKFVLL